MARRVTAIDSQEFEIICDRRGVIVLGNFSGSFHEVGDTSRDKVIISAGWDFFPNNKTWRRWFFDARERQVR